MSNQSKGTASDSGSDSENESEEEETTKEKAGAKQQVVVQDDDDEEDDEDDESSETDSDAGNGAQHDTIHKVVRQGQGVKSSSSEPPVGKRGRDLNGAKVGPMEEPANKKRKETKDDKGRAQALKSASPTKGSKVEQVAKTTRAGGRGEKARSAQVGKAESGQEQALGRKAKPVATTQAAANSRQPTQKTAADKASPQKAKKTAHWSNNLETSLSNLMYSDIQKTGKVMPVSRLDIYWESLLKRLPLEGEMTELQVVDKVKRMRNRYHFLQRKLKEDAGRSHFKNLHEEKLFQIWEGIWGLGNESIARGPVAAHAASDDDESDDDDDSVEAAAPSREVAKPVVGQRESEESSSEEENTRNARRKTAGLNQINASGKPPPAITPFVSKPRLEYTPVRMDKRKGSLKDNEELPSGDQHTGEDGKENSIQSELLKRVRADTSSMFREFRLQLLDEFRGDRTGALGGLGSSYGGGSRLGDVGGLEGSAHISQLRKEWREFRVKEISLQTERMELVIRELRIEQELLKSRPAA